MRTWVYGRVTEHVDAFRFLVKFTSLVCTVHRADRRPRCQAVAVQVARRVRSRVFQRFWPLRRYRLRNGLYMISTRIYANNREGRILTFPRFLIIYTRVRPRVHIYVNSIKLVFGFRFFKIKQNIYFANGTLLLSGYRMVFFKNNKSLMECPPGLLRHGMCVQRSGLIRQTSAETTQNCLLHTTHQHHSQFVRDWGTRRIHGYAQLVYATTGQPPRVGPKV